MEIDWKEKYKITNNKLEQLVELISDGYWEWNPTKQYSDYFSLKFEQIIGYTPDELKDPDIWKDIILPEDQESVSDAFTKHLQDPSTPFYKEITYKHKNGNIVN